MKFLNAKHNPYFIAEIGSNHKNDIKHVLKLIKDLAKNGADAIKFQLFTAESLYSKSTPIFPGEKLKPYDIAKKVELPRNWLKQIKSAVEDRNIDFICSPFSIEDIDALEKINVKVYKIASSEINDVILIKHIASTKKAIFLSAGMASLADIELALETIDCYGPCEVILLQCTALYPTPPNEVNLNAMRTLKDAFGLEVGFSDHSLGIHLPLAAVALGARVIEKHVTTNRELNGPDHFFAITPEEFGEMVDHAREIRAALGTGRKNITAGESKKRHLSQRSIVTKREIFKGEIFKKNDLTTKRPGYGIPPKFLSLILGHRATKNIPKDEVIKWEYILD